MAIQTSVNKTWDVAVVGEIFADHVFSGFARWPQPGEEHFTDDYVREAGGGAAITACALGNLGRSVAIFAVMGEEDVWLQERLRSFGVDLHGLRLAPTHTAVTVSISTQQDRSFLTWPGANRMLPAYLSEAEIPLRLIEARHVHFALPLDREFASYLLPQLRSAGCTFSIDVGHQVEWLQDPANWLTCGDVDFFLPNEKEGHIMTGSDRSAEVLASLADKGIRGAVLKLGAAGAAAWADGQIQRARALTIEAVDTTGAGDVFDAGLIDAFLDHAELPEILKRACLCGSLSTRRAGALAALPDREELTKLYGQFRQQ
jgi:sugar/nucleoside kinase (ribokinase family)